MMNVSEAFLEAINASFRNIVAKVEIYFDGENNSPTLLESNKIIDMKLLEEASADSANPLGVISSNELTLTLYNENGAFTISNKYSPYYNKIIKHLLIIPYLGIELKDESIEYIPMGKYWTEDWQSPSSSIESQITAYDYLYTFGQQTVPDTPIMRNVDIKQVFIKLFSLFGLTSDDYIIDPTLSRSLSYVWFSSTVKNTLQKLCTAGNCTVCMTRHGKIYVKSNNTNNAVVATLNDQTQITSAQNKQTYNILQSRVNLTYSVLAVSDVLVLASITGYSLKQGINNIRNLTFSEGMVLDISRISISGPEVDVQNIVYGSSYINFDIIAPSNITVDMVVYGTRLIKTDTLYTEAKQDILDVIGDIAANISSDIIQDAATAKEITKEILNIVSIKDSLYVVNCIGNPALELLDNIIIDDESDKIYGAKVTILRQQITWDGSLSIDLTCRLIISTVINFDLKRRIAITKSVSHDTLRKKSTTLGETKRLISKNTIVVEDTKRLTGINTSVVGDTNRNVYRAFVLNFNSSDTSQFDGENFIMDGTLHNITTKSTSTTGTVLTNGTAYTADLVDSSILNNEESAEVI